MLLLRYQRQHQLEVEESRREVPEIEMRKKLTNRDVKCDNRRAATRSTLICIFICGSLLLGLGITLLLVGLLLPEMKSNPTPWLVTGPTCIVLGILVLLLSVEIILKLRKISGSDGDCKDESSDVSKCLKKGWGSSSGDVRPVSENDETIPIVIQPPSPMELDPSKLPLAGPEK